MVRGSSTKQSHGQNGGEPNPEIEQRRRLKELSRRKNMLAAAPARTRSALAPSKAVAKHHGRDVVKKSQRKNLRFLFAFPGLLAPVGGGKIGELKDLGTKNPVLYLDFPQGQMKLFGTIVYPENRYLTLQFARGGKSVICEDYFDTMIVFSDAWWIGKRDENPEEFRLEFPKELTERQNAEYDFKGGAGAGVIYESNLGVHKTPTKFKEEQFPKEVTEDDLSEGENIVGKQTEVTPVRHSLRTAGKQLNFAESSEDSSIGGHDGSSEEERDLEAGNFSPVEVDVGNEDSTAKACSPKQNEESPMTATGFTNPKMNSGSRRGSLVQSTLSTLFKKVEDKAPSFPETAPSPNGSGKKSQRGAKRKNEKAAGCKKREKIIKEQKAGRGRPKKKDQYEVEDDDDIEVFSSSSQGTDGSDEDWEA